MGSGFDAAEGWSRQLRKGILDLALLSHLRDGAIHGYALIQKLKAAGLMAPEGAEATIYQALQRLAVAGLARSTWSHADANDRPRKLYDITVAGQAAYQDMTREWRALRKSMDRLQEKA